MRSPEQAFRVGKLRPADFVLYQRINITKPPPGGCAVNPAALSSRGTNGGCERRDASTPSRSHSIGGSSGAGLPRRQAGFRGESQRPKSPPGWRRYKSCLANGDLCAEANRARSVEYGARAPLFDVPARRDVLPARAISATDARRARLGQVERGEIQRRQARLRRAGRRTPHELAPKGAERPWAPSRQGCSPGVAVLRPYNTGGAGRSS